MLGSGEVNIATSVSNFTIAFDENMPAIFSFPGQSTLY